MNCAEKMSGAWWYTNCGQAAFNAYNYGTADKISVEGGGIYWKTFTGYSYPLKSGTMAIRPLNID